MKFSWKNARKIFFQVSYSILLPLVQKFKFQNGDLIFITSKMSETYVQKVSRERIDLLRIQLIQEVNLYGFFSMNTLF